MADSIPSLRRKLAEKEVEIKALSDQLKQAKSVIQSPVVYIDNPDHIATIRQLQDKLCQFTSQ